MNIKRDPMIALSLVLIIEMTTLIIININLLKAAKDVEPSLETLADLAKRFS